MSPAGSVQKLIQGDGTPLDQWQASASLARVPCVDAVDLVPAGCRLVVVAPHPDDEILTCGGLLASLCRREQDLLLVSVTDGEASHKGSARWTRESLRLQRPLESQAALQALGLNVDTLRWLRTGLADSAVAKDENFLAVYLMQRLRPGDRVVTTWRGDGHCDHESVGRACALATQASHAYLMEVPVWAWHWATPDDPRLPWERARKVMLDADMLRRKRRAICAHRSQIQPDGAQPAVLAPHTLERLLQPFELVFV